MINAEVHSDDHKVHASFDATLWFQCADDEDIVSLASENYCFDYTSDNVAMQIAEIDDNVAKVFSYVETSGQGFGCSVAQGDAEGWIMNNRPHLASDIGIDDVYVNHYECPCGTSWNDTWSCACNDRCPDCGKEIEPTTSDLIT